ncbi:hypothetical protein [Staphylococcus delphini]|uniref:hypothetical protein n=1 Tax=Staphylococcus delphini TaxID=53344 RepID=UPI0023B3382A|nr:hypothetical protein [Staphylococcus delphini]MDE9799250.1 hypothetical protein [Staphylococcus delphini]MDE9806032.1 hypothetical protein [Staphylococcus delphini]
MLKKQCMQATCPKRKDGNRMHGTCSKTSDGNRIQVAVKVKQGKIQQIARFDDLAIKKRKSF